jgi:hypothetical protein
MVFGTGFAPFRGGPLYYLEHLPGNVPDNGNTAGDEKHHGN